MCFITDPELVAQRLVSLKRPARRKPEDRTTRTDDEVYSGYTGDTPLEDVLNDSSQEILFGGPPNHSMAGGTGQFPDLSPSAD